MPPSILVIEPDPGAGERLVRVLAAAGFDAAVAQTGRGALELLDGDAFALVLLDLGLDGEDGFALLADLAAGPAAPTVVTLLPAAERTASTVLALELGAADCLDAACHPAELVARLRRHAGAVAAPESPRVGRWALHSERRVADDGARAVALSPLEFRLLEHLVARRGAVCSREELVRHVWPPDAADAAAAHHANVVDVCVRRLRRKLGADVIRTVRGVGYRLG